MYMKKLMPMLIALMGLVACEKEADLDKLDNEYMVVTNYDTKTDFSSFSTYYMPDSILLITNQANATYWTADSSAVAAKILDTFRSNMDDICTETSDKSAAELGLQISYVASTYYFTSWAGSPWWNSYPGYWSYGYWGGWGGWYYPYPITFSYSTGSILAELVDLTATTQSSSSKLQVVWSADISGLLNRNNALDLTQTLNGINQAFTQSAYLKK